MAIFTTTSKNRLNWQARPSANTPTPTVFFTEEKNRLNWESPIPQPKKLLISDGYYLDIGGFDLLISPFGGSRDKTNWQEVTKTR